MPDLLNIKSPTAGSRRDQNSSRQGSRYDSQSDGQDYSSSEDGEEEKRASPGNDDDDSENERKREQLDIAEIRLQSEEDSEGSDHNPEKAC